MVSNYQVSIDYCEHYHFTPEDLANWPGAVLILKADTDEALKRYREYTVALTTLYPQAQVHVFHGAGHVPPITMREEYIQVLQRFLAGGSSAQSVRENERAAPRS